ncbi:MAG TPA: hypothetical protein PK718_00215 [Candidatus Methanofastidiosa archaeon]|nr:hypothetical protein [Candidatus Methanofastidiosa archaeon]
MTDEGEMGYKDVSYILGLKVIPGKENDIREKIEKIPGVFKSFKALGQFDVILMAKDLKEAKSVMKKVKNIENVLDVFFIELE